jgi:hypothetical protein
MKLNAKAPALQELGDPQVLTIDYDCILLSEAISLHCQGSAVLGKVVEKAWQKKDVRVDFLDVVAREKTLFPRGLLPNGRLKEIFRQKPQIPQIDFDSLGEIWSKV